MNLLFPIFRYFPHGGLQRDMLRIAEAAVKRGHSVTVATMEWRSPDKPPEGVTVELFPRRGMTNHGRAAAFARDVRHFAAGKKFDFIFGFNRMPGLDFYFAADNCFAKSAERHSDLVLTLVPRYRTFLRFEREIFAPESKTHVFYLTWQQRRDFQQVYGTPAERFTLLPPGISADRRRPPEAEAAAIRERKRAELGIRSDQILLLEVGSSFYTKGVDRMLWALSKLPKPVAVKTRLFVAGRDKNKNFPTLASELGLAGKVVFAGGRSDVPELLLAADLLVHPARNEAAGAVLIEALAAGTPVLCTANCGFANYVHESGGAVFTGSFEEKAFLALFEKILTTPGKLDAMRQAAIAYGEKADFYRRADAVIDVLEEAEHEANR